LLPEKSKKTLKKINMAGKTMPFCENTGKNQLKQLAKRYENVH